MKAKSVATLTLILSSAFLAPAQEHSTRCAAAGHWIGQEIMTLPNSKKPDGSPIQLSFPLSIVVSPAGDQVFYEIQGSPGKTWATNSHTQHTITWGKTELVPYQGVGKARTTMRMKLTVQPDGATATLKGSHTVLEGPLKGSGDSVITASLRKVE